MGVRGRWVREKGVMDGGGGGREHRGHLGSRYRQGGDGRAAVVGSRDLCGGWVMGDEAQSGKGAWVEKMVGLASMWEGSTERISRWSIE